MLILAFSKIKEGPFFALRKFLRFDLTCRMNGSFLFALTRLLNL